MDKYTKFLDKDYLLGDSLSLSLSLVGELESADKTNNDEANSLEKFPKNKTNSTKNKQNSHENGLNSAKNAPNLQNPQSLISHAKSLKLAIQAHIYYVDMIAEFIAYLKDSPFEFDLLVSVNSSEKQGICEQKFTRKTLPRLKNLLVKITPNVGRDVAPFLIAFKDELVRYDLVCHIHTKKSPANQSVSGWADYLLRNLISREAMANIIVHFASDEGLGMVFPPAFYDYGVFDAIFKPHKNDRANMQALLDRLKIDLVPNESNFIFSPGTMFWARPEALKSLFELGLSYDEFPREPIANTGTLAHAIERVFGIVAEHNGYKVKCYATQKELAAGFFAAYELFEFKRKAVQSFCGEGEFLWALEQLRLKTEKMLKFECRFLGVRIFKIRQKTLEKFIKFLPLKFKALFWKVKFKW